MAATLAAVALMCVSPGTAAALRPDVDQVTDTPVPRAPSVTLAVVPRGTSVAELARMPGMALGVMSAGIGEVPSEQTFVDISQGNRIDDGLYDQALPGLFPFAREVPGWSDVIDRARDAPADIVPGLLASQLQAGGVPSSAERPMVASALVAAGRQGIVSPFRPRECVRRCPGLSVVSVTTAELAGLVRRLRRDDLLIALASTPPPIDGTIPIGVAGRGFDGNLTSDSTRTNGYVLSTDIAPTILRRFGLAIPDEMDGESIRAEGEPDPAAIEDRAERMTVIPDRRGPDVILCLVAWIVIAAVVGLLKPNARRGALAWLALAFAYMPLMLLAGAAVQPSAVAEGLMIGIGAAVLAALTLIGVRGWWALAIACAITVVAYAIDVVAGSGLTTLSLLGPNPVFGVRFYGIGNELEALIAVMVPVAVGAALTGRAGSGRPPTRRAAVAAFLGVAGLSTIFFAAGRFGADVGAAIVLPVGAAVAAVLVSADLNLTVSPFGRRATTRGHSAMIAVVVAAPIVALAALSLIDLVSGGNAHLTRSILDAGGAGNLADIAERRVRLSAHDFAQAAGNPLFWVIVVGIVAAAFQWRRIDGWLEPVPAARAGVIGACAAVAVGVLVNDSGATFLVLGSLALGATLAFAWAQAGTDP